MIQTALVLSSTYTPDDGTNNLDPNSVDYGSMMNQLSGVHPDLSPEAMRTDGRIRPAYYIMSVVTISFLALTFGSPYIKRRREQYKQMCDQQQQQHTTDATHNPLIQNNNVDHNDVDQKGGGGTNGDNSDHRLVSS